MLKDFKVRLENKPGALAELAEALGKEGVNIEGFCGPCEEEGFAHVLIDDTEAARNAFIKGGITLAGEREVLVLDLEDKPGELGRVCRLIADAKVNIDFFYAASKTRVVLGVADLVKARSALA